jgi:hypothetical protein
LAITTANEIPLRPSREAYLYLASFLLCAVLVVATVPFDRAHTWLPATLCLIWAAVAGGILLGRSLLLFRGIHAYRPTGRVVPSPPVTRERGELHVNGRVMVPVRRGRIAAPGHLWLRGDRLQVGLATDSFASRLGARPLDAHHEDVAAVRPLRGILGEEGLVIEPWNQPPYFLARAAERDRLLAAIEAAGFTVDWHEQVIRL